MTKYIKGSWFEFQHHNKPEGVYWNTACAAFKCADWDAKVKEVSELGMEYLVLMEVALDYKAFYDTDILPKAELACNDPIAAILTAGDKYGVKFFIGADFFGDWQNPHDCITNPDIIKKRLKSMGELAERYGSHKSFYGWYWANEACIDKYYSNDFINYVNCCSKEARMLTPYAPKMIAPYGTRIAVPDDTYVKQLELLDVDIIAYQDEIGVQKTRVEESAAFFEGLRKAHDKVPQVAIWADVEVFRFEGEVYKSALLPAPFSRVEKQLQAVSPYVDNILIYQYQGMMNKPDSLAFAGHRDSTILYKDYVNWLNTNHPGVFINNR